MANFPSAGTTIADGATLPEVIKALRFIQTQQARNLATSERQTGNDPVRAFSKDAMNRGVISLYAQEGPVSLQIANRPVAGDVLYAIDALNAAWGSAATAAPTGGTVFPAVGSYNALLDGVYHTDTVATTVVRGKMIVGNATPKWAGLVIGAANRVLASDGTDPSWTVLTTAHLPAAVLGWTDDGTVVRLTTSTDQVGIGTASPAACLGVVNVNATSDVILKVTAKASQSGAVLSLLNSNARNLAAFDSAGNLMFGNTTDVTRNVIVRIGGGANVSTPAAEGHTIITWGDNGNNLSAPACTADMLGCAGARFYPYKDSAGTYDVCYGQDSLAAWVLVGPEDITYDFWSGGQPGVITPFLRASWAGNGDLTNYGKIRSRKSTGAGTKGVPGIELEETGAGTDVIKLRAPAAVGADRTQLMQDLNATLVVVGDKAPTVGSRQLGKIDLTAQTADIASTNLTNSAPAGFYEIQAVLEDTTADITAGTVTVTFGWTDDVGATTDATLTQTLVATGRSRITIPLYLASGAITYTVAHTGIFGSGAYALRIRVLALG